MRTIDEIKADITKAAESDPEVKLQEELKVLMSEREDLTERCNREANREGNIRKLLVEVKDLVLKPRFQGEIR
jgi:hypothetical protein